ncbi:hypothetical protein B0H10DRAFT_1942573 [Mycena sp. CBHHK59/15]|nr:hypothetical protein B0H10DRAFT_1942573 [Mycena sp. CBHHK59/15]
MSGIEIGSLTAFPGRRFNYWQTRASGALKTWDQLGCKDHVPPEALDVLSQRITRFESLSKAYIDNQKVMARKERFRQIGTVKRIGKELEAIIQRTSRLAIVAEAYCKGNHGDYHDANGRCSLCHKKGKNSSASPPTTATETLTEHDPTLSPGFRSHETRTVIETNGVIRETTTRIYCAPGHVTTPSTGSPPLVTNGGEDSESLKESGGEGSGNLEQSGGEGSGNLEQSSEPVGLQLTGIDIPEIEVELIYAISRNRLDRPNVPRASPGLHSGVGVSAVGARSLAPLDGVFAGEAQMRRWLRGDCAEEGATKSRNQLRSGSENAPRWCLPEVVARVVTVAARASCLRDRKMCEDRRGVGGVVGDPHRLVATRGILRQLAFDGETYLYHRNAGKSYHGSMAILIPKNVASKRSFKMTARVNFRFSIAAALPDATQGPNSSSGANTPMASGKYPRTGSSKIPKRRSASWRLQTQTLSKNKENIAPSVRRAAVPPPPPPKAKEPTDYRHELQKSQRKIRHLCTKQKNLKDLVLNLKVAEKTREQDHKEAMRARGQLGAP